MSDDATVAPALLTRVTGKAGDTAASFLFAETAWPLIDAAATMRQLPSRLERRIVAATAWKPARTAAAWHARCRPSWPSLHRA